MSEQNALVPISADDVRNAAQLISSYIRTTPILWLSPDDTGLNGPVCLKLESLQITGTFKARNAFSLLLSADVPRAGIVAVSGGNFGFAMAYAARALGYPITVFVPEIVPEIKARHMRDLGANVEIVSSDVKDLFSVIEDRVAETGALSGHPFDQPEVIAGAGTCAVEFEQQASGLDTVLVAVGGGGLMAGIATWMGSRTRIVAVETAGTPTLYNALQAGEPVTINPEGIAASSLGAPRIGRYAWRAAREHVHSSVLVTDEQVRASRRELWETARLITEPGGAVAYAALYSGAYVPEPNERVGVVVCGANADPGTIPDH